MPLDSCGFSRLDFGHRSLIAMSINTMPFSISNFDFKEFIMRPSSRRGVSKRGSARSFRKHTMRTKSANMAAPMRGGWRL